MIVEKCFLLYAMKDEGKTAEAKEMTFGTYMIVVCSYNI